MRVAVVAPEAITAVEASVWLPIVVIEKEASFEKYFSSRYFFKLNEWIKITSFF